MNWIADQYRTIEQHKLNLEKCIDDIKLLFKPWPIKREDGDRENRPAEATSTVEEKASLSPVLTAEEEQGVAMVDNLLKKAQKARDVQKKLAEPKRTKIHVKEAAKPDKLQHQENISESDTEQQTSNTGGTNTPNSEAQAETKTKHGVKPFKHKPLLSKPAASNKSANEKVKSQDTRSVRSGSNSSMSDKSVKSNISRRPQSSSGQRKVVPAHASAPFQTNPRLASTKMQTTYRASTSRTAAKVKQQSSASAIGSRRSQHGAESAVGVRGQNDASFHRNKQSEPLNANRIQESRTLNQAEMFSEEKKSHIDYNAVSYSEPLSTQYIRDDSHVKMADRDVQRVASEMSSIKIHGKARANENDVKEESEKKQFSLVTDGGSLKVPGKLKKLVYQNKKLREKLYTQTVTQKVDSPDLDPSEFPLHLEHSFGDETAKQAQLQARQAEYLVNVYTSLQELLDSLHLDTISGRSDTADVYRARCLMEHILTVYQQTEELLHQADFRLLQQCHTSPVCDHSPPQMSLPRSSMVWYDKCAAYAHAQPKLVKYSSYHEMERYMDAAFHIQWLQLQLDMQSHIADTLIPLLNSLDPTSSEFVYALRAGYSLLSQSGGRPPVVIRDTIGEEEPEQEEEW